MVQLEILLCAEVVLSLLNLAAFIGLGLVHYTACEVRNLASCIVVVNATHPLSNLTTSVPASLCSD